VAAVGIDAETAAKLLELVKADAASRPSGKVRTKAVPAAAEKLGLKVNGTAVKILAGFCGLQTERGPGKGKGTPSGTGGKMGGRPAGIHTRYSPLREKVRELAQKGYRAGEIARELKTSRQNVHKLLSDGND
jgi:hypothetical protein